MFEEKSTIYRKEEISFIQMTEYRYQEYEYEVAISEEADKTEYVLKNLTIYFDFEVNCNQERVHLRINEFHTSPKRSGIGRAVFVYMLDMTLKKCRMNNIDKFTISGMLSSIDENKGEWPDSLIAYKKLGERFALDFYITDMTAEMQYKNTPDSLKKDKYSDVFEFYNPKKGKSNSGHLHYAGHVEPVTDALDVYRKQVIKHKEIMKNEEEQCKRKQQEMLMNEGNEDFNPIIELFRKILKLFKNF